MSVIQTPSRCPALYKLSGCQQWRALMSRAITFYLCWHPKVWPKSCLVYCEAWWKELALGGLVCVFSASFWVFFFWGGVFWFFCCCFLFSGNPPKMWSQTGCSNRKRLGAIHILNSKSLARNIALSAPDTSRMSYSRVSASYRVHVNVGRPEPVPDEQTCGLSRRSLAHGNNPPL